MGQSGRLWAFLYLLGLGVLPALAVGATISGLGFLIIEAKKQSKIEWKVSSVQLGDFL